MLDYLKKNKIMALGGAVAILAVIYYAFYFGGSSAPSLSSPSDTPSAPVSQKLVVMLTSLKTIRLSDSVFKDPVFQSLTDFGVVIPQQNVGRRNPFAPLSGGAAPAGQKLPTSTKTPTTGR